MTAEMIFAILQGVLGAAPELLSLFTQAQSGTPVTASQVSTVLTQYGIDRAVFAAAIATANASQATTAAANLQAARVALGKPPGA